MPDLPRKLTPAVPLGVVALVVALALVAACDGEAEPPPTPPPAASPAATAVPILDGQTLFRQTCAVCHGVDLQGTNQGPPFLDRIYAPGHHSDASFRLAVQRGVVAHHWTFGNMPKIEGLSEEQVEAIIAYVRDQQKQAGVY
ncbi:MAG: cytochrome c [Chloroflexi bacterium]|nr:cytochrome c [Chloroflexota bacterium]